MIFKGARPNANADAMEVDMKCYWILNNKNFRQTNIYNCLLLFLFVLQKYHDKHFKHMLRL